MCDGVGQLRSAGRFPVRGRRDAVCWACAHGWVLLVAVDEHLGQATCLISIKRSVLVTWASLSSGLVTAWPLWATLCDAWLSEVMTVLPAAPCTDIPCALAKPSQLAWWIWGVCVYNQVTGRAWVCNSPKQGITWSWTPPCVFSAEISVTLSGTAQMCLSPPQALEGVMVGKQQLFKHSGMSHCSPRQPVPTLWNA